MNPELPTAPDPRIAAFVGRRVEYYDRAWQSFADPNSSHIRINVAAVLFSAVWLLYRKLYLHFGMMMAVIILDIQLTTYLEDREIVPAKAIAAWDQIAPFVYAAVVGGLGNLWYFRRFQSQDRESLAVSPDPLVQEEFLRNKGGVSYLSPAAFLLAMALLLMWAMQPAV